MIDKRVIERQIRKGKLDAAAHRRTLEGLPDLSDRVARDYGEEPSRSVAAAPSTASSGLERAPEPVEPDVDDVDEDDDEDDEEESPEASASY